MPDYSAVRPELVAHIEKLAKEAADNPQLQNLSVAEARARAEETFPLRWGEKEPIEFEDRMVMSDGAEVRIRIYRPEDATGTLLFIHGGGWKNGSVDSHDGSVRMFANLSRINIVSINYRKAPEHPYPAGLNDCEAGLRWVIDEGAQHGLDTKHIMVSGESAGGNLAAALAHRAARDGIELAGQVLIYPATDALMESESYKQFATGYMLEAAGMDDNYSAYSPDAAMRAHPEISPLYADDFTAQPPGFVATCGCDVLRDEGRAYATRLISSGVDVEFVEYEGALHGIWIMRAVTPLTDAIITDAANWVRATMAKNT